MAARLQNDAKFIRKFSIVVLAPPPSLNEIDKYSFSADDLITISGTNFGTNGIVKFGDMSAIDIVSWSSNSIKCKVPKNVNSGILYLVNSGGTSNGISYQIESSTGFPERINILPNLRMSRGEKKTIANLKSIFQDPNNDVMSFIISLNNNTIIYDPDSLVAGTLIFSVTELAEGITQVIVSAIDQANQIASDTFYVNVIVKPESPKLIQPSNNSKKVYPNLELSWESIPNISEFNAEIAIDSVFTETVEVIKNINSSKHNCSQLEYDCKYYWRVCAVNQAGKSNWSDIYSFHTIKHKPEKVVLNYPIEGVENQGTALSLNWRTANYSELYRLEYDNDINFSTKKTITIDLTYYDLTNLTNGTKYFWRVVGINSDVDGDYSETRNFVTALASGPTLLEPNNNSNYVIISPKLCWLPISNADNYYIQVSKDSLFLTDVYSDSTLTITERQMNELQNGVTYYWRVRARVGGINTSWSNRRMFTTVLGSAPALIYPVHSSKNEPLNVKLKWSTVENAQSYTLEVSGDTTNISGIVYSDSTLTITERQMNELQNGVTYYWRVRARVGGINTSWSNRRMFTTEKITNVENNPETIPVKYNLHFNYPNPFNPATTISFEIPKRNFVTLKIYDAIGNEISTLVNGEREAGRYSVKFDGSNLSSGIYFYKITAGNYTETKKLILMK
jgi:hypothetical protein